MMATRILSVDSETKLPPSAVVAAIAAQVPAPAFAAVTGKPATYPPTIGGGAAQAVAGNDARLTNQRTPSDGSVTDAKIAPAGLAIAKIAGLTDALAGKVAAGTGVQVVDWGVFTAGTAPTPPNDGRVHRGILK